jgi:hypothetical protein
MMRADCGASSRAHRAVLKKKVAFIILNEGRRYAASRASADGAYEAAKQCHPEARLMLVRMSDDDLLRRPERPDLDESVGVLDVLQAKFAKVADGGALIRAGVYVNDRQVREKHIKHAIDRHNPRAEIEVEELQPAGELFAREPVIPPPRRPRPPRTTVPAHAPLQPGVDPF